MWNGSEFKTQHTNHDLPIVFRVRFKPNALHLANWTGARSHGYSRLSRLWQILLNQPREVERCINSCTSTFKPCCKSYLWIMLGIIFTSTIEDPEARPSWIGSIVLEMIFRYLRHQGTKMILETKVPVKCLTSVLWRLFISSVWYPIKYRVSLYWYVPGFWGIVSCQTENTNPPMKTTWVS